jgi:hypothetical protein
VRSAASAAVKAAAYTEAGASARRKTPFLSAMTEAAESARANSALAVRLAIAASGSVITDERLWCSFGMVVDTASVPAVATEALWPSFAAFMHIPRVSASIESTAVIKRPASRVIPRMVEDRVVVMPIETPVVPAPSVVTKKSDAEANSEEEGRTVVPDAWIGIPTGPSDNGASVHNPGVICRNIDNFGADGLDLYIGTFRGYVLLRCGVEIARLLRTAAH